MHELTINSAVLLVNLERIVLGVTYTANAIYTGFSIGDSSNNYTLAATYVSGTGKINQLIFYKVVML